MPIAKDAITNSRSGIARRLYAFYKLLVYKVGFIEIAPLHGYAGDRTFIFAPLFYAP